MSDSDTGVNHILLVSAAALFDTKGLVLLQQRPPHRSLPGLWEFPGGKVEMGETPARALARELEEELGITVAPADAVPLSFASEPLGGQHLVLLLYAIERWEGVPVARHASALKWLSPELIDPGEMPPADRPLVEAVRLRALSRST